MTAGVLNLFCDVCRNFDGDRRFYANRRVSKPPSRFYRFWDSAGHSLVASKSVVSGAASNTTSELNVPWFLFSWVVEQLWPAPSSIALATTAEYAVSHLAESQSEQSGAAGVLFAASERENWSRENGVIATRDIRSTIIGNVFEYESRGNLVELLQAHHSSDERETRAMRAAIIIICASDTMENCAARPRITSRSSDGVLPGLWIRNLNALLLS
jgi:hypothetical protein